jgi:phosphoglycolate phosphatase
VKPRLRAALFDFDMTLVDSAGAIAHCMNLLAQRAGLRPLSREEVLATIGLPIETAWGRLWGRYDPDWTRIYREEFRQAEHERLRPMPGAVEALDLLRASGVRTGLVTNRRYPRDVTALVGLADRLDLILGLEDVPRPKPDPSALVLALERLGASPEEAFYAGDTDIDMRAAAAAAVPGLGVAAGHFSREALIEAGGTWAIGSLRDFPGILAGFDLPSTDLRVPREGAACGVPRA